MKKFFRKMSLVPKGMRYKLMIAFCLTSLIPLWVMSYLCSTYIFPALDDIVYESIAVLFTILIAFLGLVFARRLIEPVIDMALEAKIIANGDFNREIKVEAGDEIGEIGTAINEMTKRIRTNLEELSSYGERTKEINLEIHKKVIALSNLLQVGDAITASRLSLSEILNLVSEKVAQTCETGYTLLLGWKDDNEEAMSVESCYNIPNNSVKEIRVRKGEDALGELLKDPRIVTVDSEKTPSGGIKSFVDQNGLKNLVILPVTSRAKLVGFLFVGNQLDGFVYKDDDVELFKVFARQVAIAIENDYLLKRTKELSITDDLTGLYNKKYIISRLEEEIKRSILFQRPCSFLLVSVDNFDKLQETYDAILIEKALKRIAGLVRDNLTEIGKAARMGVNEFALLLPETNKRGAAKMAEDIRKVVEEAFSEKTGPEDIEKLTVSIGVSENPIDGATAKELIDKAEKAVDIAKASGKNRVVARIE